MRHPLPHLRGNQGLPDSKVQGFPHPGSVIGNRSPDHVSLPSVHPVVRLITFIVFAAVMGIARPELLAIGTFLLVVAYMLAGLAVLHGFFILTRRIRWLLISIVVVYGWWTPGEPVIPVLGGLSPGLAGLQAGGLRVWMLLVMVAGINLVLESMERQDLLMAIMRLLGPLRIAGISPARVSVRMILVLEAVPEVQSLIQAALTETVAGSSGFARITGAATRVYQAVLMRSASAEKVRIHIPDHKPVPEWQWLLPLALACMPWLLP